MQRPFETFLGVDLGGGKGKTTAVARLALTDDRPEVMEVSTAAEGRSPWYDDVLLAYAAAHRQDAVLAIDAPLTLTACVRCQLPECPGTAKCVDKSVVWLNTIGHDLVRAADESSKKPAITPYTQRATEVVLHRRHGIVPRETLGQGMGPLTARAAHLVRALAGLGYKQHDNLIEVYPKATLHALHGPKTAQRYKGGIETWKTRAEIFESMNDSLGFSVKSRMAREACLVNDNCFDAVICAYTAYLWARDGWSIPEEQREVFLADGWIYGPGIQDTR